MTIASIPMGPMRRPDRVTNLIRLLAAPLVLEVSTTPELGLAAPLLDAELADPVAGDEDAEEVELASTSTVLVLVFVTPAR